MSSCEACDPFFPAGGVAEHTFVTILKWHYVTVLSHQYTTDPETVEANIFWYTRNNITGGSWRAHMYLMCQDLYACVWYAPPPAFLWHKQSLSDECKGHFAPSSATNISFP